jgi:hypothetical protein
MKKNVSFFCLLTFASLGCYFFFQYNIKSKDGFSLSKITAPMQYREDFSFPPLDLDHQRELAVALSQPYHYLAKGGQCFVFISSDEQYVIKFLRHSRHKIPFFAEFTMPAFVKSRVTKSVEKKKAKLERDLLSYSIATHNFPNQTALICTHLNPTKTLQTSLKVTDKHNRKYSIDLDTHQFIVQKKAKPFFDTLLEMIQEGKKEEIKNGIDALLSFLRERSQMGIFDRDARLATNFGFLGSTPVEIDIGSFRFDPSRKVSKVFLQDIYHIITPMQEWLNKNDPDLANFLHDKMKTLEIEI